MVTEQRCALIGSVCLLFAGCFSYGHYPPPNAYLPPQSAMIPADATIPRSPGTVWVPAGPSGSVPAGGVIAPDPAHSSENSADGSTGDSAPGRTVPDPMDAGRPSNDASVDSFGLDERARNEPEYTIAARRPRPRPLANSETLEFARRATEQLDTSALPEIESAGSAATPTTLRSAEFSTQVRSSAVTPASATGDRFGYDTEDYTWLSGRAEFDSRQQVWHLTYDLTPDEADQFGGEVTLKNTAHFKYLRSGEFVRVEGAFDSQQRDRLGKPLYEATRLIRNAQR